MIETFRAGAPRRPVLYKLHKLSGYALAIIAATAIASACYTFSYKKQVAANTDLIAGLADKLADYCRAGFLIGDRPVSSEEMGEFYYALSKAKGFVSSAGSHSKNLSYRHFNGMLTTYGIFLHHADEYRLRGHNDPEQLKQLLALHDAVEQTAVFVRRDLQQGN